MRMEVTRIYPTTISPTSLTLINSMMKHDSRLWLWLCTTQVSSALSMQHYLYFK